MAKRSPQKGDNTGDMNRASYRIDDTIQKIYRAVCDETTHDKLDAILGALGGSADTTATIYNVNIISAGIEVAQALPANTKKFLIRSRNRGRLRLAYSLGGTNTDYLTIPPGSSYVDDQFYIGVTIYFQSTKPGDVIEIITYS